MGKAKAVMVVGLTLAGCGSKDTERTANPPPPEPAEQPEEPVLPPMNPPTPLPTWDDVRSGHPPGATNPPRPELIVTPDGDCYKRWRPGMLAPQPGEPHGDRVEACEADCGVAIVCPDKAETLLAEWRAEQGDEAE
jgi:hypothetical protein